ncbi:MAG: SDR family oxidoreductase [Rhodospirillaceae bacterium]|nr:SDR family oxidoreductase [Rhodospirillaceae bacterium]
MVRRWFGVLLLATLGIWGSAQAQDEAASSATPPAPAREGVIVFGGNRATGLEVVKSLVARGEKVTVMVRPSSDTAELKKLGVATVIGDAMNAEESAKAAASGNFKAAVSTLGGGGDPKNRPDWIGNKNVIDAAKAAGIERFVFVTVIGTGTSAPANPYFTRIILKEVTSLKEQAENYLIASGLKYTIIRPGGLLARPAEGKSVLTEDATKFSWMIREDLGKLTADTLYDDTTINKIYTAFDPTRDSFMSGLFDRFEE